MDVQRGVIDITPTANLIFSVVRYGSAACQLWYSHLAVSFYIQDIHSIYSGRILMPDRTQSQNKVPKVTSCTCDLGIAL